MRVTRTGVGMITGEETWKDLAAFLDDGMEEEEVYDDPVELLYRTWRNERAAPEILEAPAGLLESILELLEIQANRGPASLNVVDCIYQMDAERIKFVLKSWLRCRLAKIERNWAAFWPTWSDSERAANALARLLPAEREYLESLSSSLVSALQEGCLSRLPADLSSLQDPEMLADGSTPIALPTAANSHVICRVRRDFHAGEIVLDPVTRATAFLEPNDTFVLQYEVIKDFLSNGEIELI